MYRNMHEAITNFYVWTKLTSQREVWRKLNHNSTYLCEEKSQNKFLAYPTT